MVDASYIIHGRDLRIFAGLGKLVTTRHVIEELRDARSIAMLDILGLEVVDVDEEEVAKLAKRFNISTADASVLAAAKKLRCTVLTDDAGLAKAAKRLGLSVAGLYFIR